MHQNPGAVSLHQGVVSVSSRRFPGAVSLYHVQLEALWPAVHAGCGAWVAPPHACAAWASCRRRSLRSAVQTGHVRDHFPLAELFAARHQVVGVVLSWCAVSAARAVEAAPLRQGSSAQLGAWLAPRLGALSSAPGSPRPAAIAMGGWPLPVYALVLAVG